VTGDSASQSNNPEGSSSLADEARPRSAPSAVSQSPQLHENLQQPSNNRQLHSSGSSSNDCSNSSTQATSSSYTVSSDNVAGFFHQQQSSDVVHHDGHCDLQLLVEGQSELSVNDRDLSVILSPKIRLQEMTIAGQNSFDCESANARRVVKSDLEEVTNVPNIVNESTWLFETGQSKRSSSPVLPIVQSTLRNSTSSAEPSTNPLKSCATVSDSVDNSEECGGARSKLS